MKNGKSIGCVAALTASLFVAGCEVEQTRQAELPDVDVDVEEGQMPAWNVDGPDVNVGVREETVEIPKVRFETERESISVPYIDIDLPNADDVEREERELAVEFDADQGGYDVEIQEVRGTGDQLYVIARLTEPDSPSDIPGRVSDRVVINAPDAEVAYYVIGDRPSGASARRYRFLPSENALPERVRSARVIYDGGVAQSAL